MSAYRGRPGNSLSRARRRDDQTCPASKPSMHDRAALCSGRHPACPTRCKNNGLAPDFAASPQLHPQLGAQNAVAALRNHPAQSLQSVPNPAAQSERRTLARGAAADYSAALIAATEKEEVPRGQLSNFDGQLKGDAPAVYAQIIHRHTAGKRLLRGWPAKRALTQGQISGAQHGQACTHVWCAWLQGMGDEG